MEDRFDTRTFGEIAADFSPEEENRVAREVRREFADVIDTLHAVRGHALSEGQKEAAHSASVAITNAQTACMWAVRAAYGK